MALHSPVFGARLSIQALRSRTIRFRPHCRSASPLLPFDEMADLIWACLMAGGQLMEEAVHVGIQCGTLFAQKLLRHTAVTVTFAAPADTVGFLSVSY